ncbi:MAG: hypothetical protein IPH34_12940 [Chitinophagaceae bacterium]|nr:hypothetical protein [Chitinophagaceae bacterium]
MLPIKQAAATAPIPSKTRSPQPPKPFLEAPPKPPADTDIQGRRSDINATPARI